MTELSVQNTRQITPNDSYVMKEVRRISGSALKDYFPSDTNNVIKSSIGDIKKELITN